MVRVDRVWRAELPVWVDFISQIKEHVTKMDGPPWEHRDYRVKGCFDIRIFCLAVCRLHHVSAHQTANTLASTRWQIGFALELMHLFMHLELVYLLWGTCKGTCHVFVMVVLWLVAHVIFNERSNMFLTGFLLLFCCAWLTCQFSEKPNMFFCQNQKNTSK